MKPLVMCAVFKNEAPFLLEWIAYHRVIGFEHFVLYDNGSTDGGAARIRTSWAGACCTVIDWPRRPGQLTAYRHFIYNFALGFEWAAFLDLDEFLLPLSDVTVGNLLQALDGYSAVLVHWRVFGPCHLVDRPDRLVIESYDRRAVDTMPVNGHVKSIVRCADVLDVAANPHEFLVKNPVCNTLGRPVDNVAIQPIACHERLVINHYFTKSRQDWMAKIRRGSGMVQAVEPRYEDDLFDHMNAISQTQDDMIKRFAPRVRRLLDGSETRRDVGSIDPVLVNDQADRLTVVVHVQQVGDVDGQAGDWIGTRGGGRWIEGFSLTPQHGVPPKDIGYRVVLGRDRATRWIAAGSFCGTRGLGLPVHGFAVRLRGETVARYECFYAATFIDGSHVGPVASADLCMAESLAPLEALRIVLRPLVSGRRSPRLRPEQDATGILPSPRRSRRRPAQA